MKVSVDKNTCTGCGLCVDSCPEVFEMQGDTAGVKMQNVTDAALAGKAKDAASNCPVEAIKAE